MKRLMTCLALSFPLVAAAQPPADVETLFEAGQYAQVVEAVAASTNPADIYLAARSHERLRQPAEARATYERIATQGGAWPEVAQSAIHLLDNNHTEALAAANRAVMANDKLAEAHYQLGLVQQDRRDYAGAAAAFEKASTLDPSFAYAHYYAGISYNRVRRIDLMAKHFELFIKLAPNAPERPEVESIMRTVRGR